jgi:hypothetical protein
MYLHGSMPLWMNRWLGAGLLTPLNKHEPIPGQPLDARPTKADDADVAYAHRALQRLVADTVRGVNAIQQVGSGVKSGVEVFALGLKLERERAVLENEDLVIVSMDLKNAHNSYFRDMTQKELETLDGSNPHIAMLERNCP